MLMRTDAMKARGVCALALAGPLLLSGCAGGGGGSEPSGSAAALVSALHFEYALTRAGEQAIEEEDSMALGCPAAGCPVEDLRQLADRADVVMRDGFQTVEDRTAGGPQPSVTVSGVSATVTGAAFTRHGFWGEHGWAAVEIGTGALSAEADGQTWTGRFSTAHAWAAGAPSGTNPAGAGGATWRGVAGAARTADFEHLWGAAELRIADLSRPLIDVHIDLDDGGDGVELPWDDVPLTAGRFAQGMAGTGTGRIEGRFHGPDHGEAFGTFDTGAYVGAFGAKRERE